MQWGWIAAIIGVAPYASGGSITDAFSTLPFSLGTRFGDALVARIVLALMLGVPAASAHLLAMAIWFGGLLVVFAYAHDAPVARFSRLAVVCWAVLALSGVYLAYRQTGELGALPHTVFGRLLLVKTAVAVGILALAYFSRRAVMRGTGARGTVAGEAILGVATLAVTAVLVNAEPAVGVPRR